MEFTFFNIYYSALHWASAQGQSEVINFLIFNGADINIQAKVLIYIFIYDGVL